MQEAKWLSKKSSKIAEKKKKQKAKEKQKDIPNRRQSSRE